MNLKHFSLVIGYEVGRGWRGAVKVHQLIKPLPPKAVWGGQSPEGTGHMGEKRYWPVFWDHWLVRGQSTLEHVAIAEGGRAPKEGSM